MVRLEIHRLTVNVTGPAVVLPLYRRLKDTLVFVSSPKATIHVQLTQFNHINAMVLTDRQRADLHSGIYEYLSSLEGFQEAAEAFAKADPVAAASVVTNGTRKNGSIPLLEKKWTAIPRLQKKVLELERQAAHNAQIHAHRTGGAADATGGGRRMLPRLPCAHTLQGHAASVTCVALHPVYTMVVSGSEDGTIKVCSVLTKRTNSQNLTTGWELQQHPWVCSSRLFSY